MHRIVPLMSSVVLWNTDSLESYLSCVSKYFLSGVKIRLRYLLLA